MTSPHNDLPTLVDKLNWGTELTRLSERIRDCEPPHVLGIHGDWGSGKTSFMRQLQARLGGEMPNDGSVAKSTTPPVDKIARHENIITIWFDAWRYQNEPVPVVALLHEMRRQMAAMPTVIAKFGKSMEIALRCTLDAFTGAGKAIGFEGIPSAENIQKYGEGWEREHHAQVLHTDSIRSHLHATIKCLLPVDEKARVVIFIDDLDRCNPKAAIHLLEGMKIYLSIPDCVFVLGTNERMLVDAIREEISAPEGTTAEELKLRAAHYFEKICTDIYRLPLPNDVTILFTNWIENTEHRHTLILALNNIVCLPPNPRRLKALANQWARFAKCMIYSKSEKEQQVWAVQVLVAAYIHQFHRDLWERWHFNPEFWVEFMAWCNGSFKFDDVSKSIITPKWAAALKLTGRKDIADIWVSEFPNPGDIDIFWMDALIREYRDNLKAQDFIPLLQGQQQNTQAAS